MNPSAKQKRVADVENGRVAAKLGGGGRGGEWTGRWGLVDANFDTKL